MEKSSLASLVDDIKLRLRESTLLRFLFVGFLCLLLQLPIALISSTVNERQMTRFTAVNDVTGVWGGRQVLGGPILVVPYRAWHKDDKGKPVEVVRRAFFLPEKLEWSGGFQPELRRRGIFTVPLYVADLKATGSFPVPDFSLLSISESDVFWNNAEIAIGISDPKALREAVVIDLAGRRLSFGPGAPGVDFLSAGIHTPIGPSKRLDKAMSFSFDLKFGGSEALHFIPLGIETQAKLASPWPDPSFDGAYLPTTRSVTKQGFEAQWRVLNLGRNFPQAWTQGEYAENANIVPASAFGVNLFTPVTAYSMTERAVKYQLLFIGLTFLVFTMFELFQGIRLHSVQYLLVGFTLCLFYLLCLSLAEHLGFDIAYVCAAVAVVAVIGGYCNVVLRGGKRAALVTALLAALYGFLYVLLHLEHNALLVGSLALFGALTAVMYLTRRVDWHNLRAPISDR